MLARIRNGFAIAILALTVAVLGLSADAYAGEGPKLSGAEIQSILSGNSITGKGFTLYYDPGGEVRGIEGGSRDTGKWWAEEDKFCVQWNKWVGGKKLCMFIWQKGNKLHRENTAGTYKDVVKVKEGNVKNL